MRNSNELRLKTIHSVDHRKLGPPPKGYSVRALLGKQRNDTAIGTATGPEAHAEKARPQAKGLIKGDPISERVAWKL